MAGSTLAYHSTLLGYDTIGYDITPYYKKACGDVLTIRDTTLRLLKATSSERAFVKNFSIRVNGREVSYLSFRSPIWAIMDKSKFVNTLREMAESNGAKIINKKGYPEVRGDSIVVDARGPYAWSLNSSILTYRLVAKASWEPETALIDFNVKRSGFYWVFPIDSDGRIINIGVGLTGVSNGRVLKKLVMRYYERIAKDSLIVIDERGAPIQVYAPVSLYSRGVFRIGEAAGLVNRTSGEGNRLAVYSAIALINAINKKFLNTAEILRDYEEGISSIVNEVKTSILMLKFIRLLDPKIAENILELLPKYFWASWLKAEITFNKLIEILAERSSYELVLGLIRAL
ncbi:MAG: NAD(P)/FAD-dependent oxidoreductase [Acidilobaceae archaeon]